MGESGDDDWAKGSAPADRSWAILGRMVERSEAITTHKTSFDLAYGCTETSGDKIAVVASQCLHVLEFVFAAGQRYAAQQQQLNVSPYGPSNIIDVLVQTPGYEEVFGLLVSIATSQGYANGKLL